MAKKKPAPPADTKKITVTMRIDPAMHQALLVNSGRTGRSLGEIIADMVERLLPQDLDYVRRSSREQED